MKRTTLLLVVVFAAAMAWYLLFMRGGKTQQEIEHDAKRLFEFDAKQISSIRITPSEGSPLRLERRADQKWRLTEPIVARADRWTADGAAQALSELERVRILRNERGSEGMKEMGLDPPRLRVEATMTPPPPPGEDSTPKPASVASSTPAPGSALEAPAPAAGATVLLEVGAEVPGTSSRFARIGGQQEEIVLVPSGSIEPLLRSPSEFRDRALVDAAVLDVGAARLTRPGGTAIRFERRNDDWWIAAPVEDLAEGSVVQGLVSSLLGLRAETFVENAGAPPSNSGDKGPSPGSPTPSAGAGDASALGLEPGWASIDLRGRKGEELATIQLGNPVPGEPDRRYARARSPSEEQPAIVTVSASGLEALEKAPSEFRTRRALPFRSWDASGLTLTSMGVNLAFTRVDGIWGAPASPAMKVSAGAIDDTLRTLSELEIVSRDAAPEASRASLGLDPPRAKIEVKLAPPSEQTLALLLGAGVGATGQIYARAEGRPGIFTVPSSILDRITAGPSLYEEKETDGTAAARNGAPSSDGTSATPPSDAGP